MTRARRDVEVRGWNLLGHADVTTIAAPDGERDREDDRCTDHGRDPTGWHSRHGIAETETRLDQPAG